MHVASPLCIGTILLEGGSSTYGFLCEADALKNAEEISQFGGWRKYQQLMNEYGFMPSNNHFRLKIINNQKPLSSFVR